MPDFTHETFYHCCTAEYWFTQVVSNGNTYVVKWDRFSHKNDDVMYDYSCTCMAYKMGRGKHCKHIRQVREQHCNWSQITDGDAPVIVDGDKCCPKCYGAVHSLQYAV